MGDGMKSTDFSIKTAHTRPRFALSGASWMSVCLTIGFLLACSGADVSGVHLKLDGEIWQVEGCESGQPMGFSGIELKGLDRSRIRLVSNPTGTGNVIYFAADSQTGRDLGACAVVAFEEGNLTINEVKSLNGGGTVDCKGGKRSLTGTVAVKDCAVPLF